MMSPYYAGGLGIPYMSSMLGLGYGMGGLGGMYGMGGLGGMYGMGLGGMGMGMGMGMGYPYGMMMGNPYGYSGMASPISFLDDRPETSKLTDATARIWVLVLAIGDEDDGDGFMLTYDVCCTMNVMQRHL